MYVGGIAYYQENVMQLSQQLAHTQTMHTSHPLQYQASSAPPCTDQSSACHKYLYAQRRHIRHSMDSNIFHEGRIVMENGKFCGKVPRNGYVGVTGKMLQSITVRIKFLDGGLECGFMVGDTFLHSLVNLCICKHPS